MFKRDLAAAGLLYYCYYKMERLDGSHNRIIVRFVLLWGCNYENLQLNKCPYEI